MSSLSAKLTMVGLGLEVKGDRKILSITDRNLVSLMDNIVVLEEVNELDAETFKDLNIDKIKLGEVIEKIQYNTFYGCNIKELDIKIRGLRIEELKNIAEKSIKKLRIEVLNDYDYYNGVIWLNGHNFRDYIDCYDIELYSKNKYVNFDGLNFGVERLNTKKIDFEYLKGLRLSTKLLENDSIEFCDRLKSIINSKIKVTSGVNIDKVVISESIEYIGSDVLDLGDSICNKLYINGKTELGASWIKGYFKEIIVNERLKEVGSYALLGSMTLGTRLYLNKMPSLVEGYGVSGCIIDTVVLDDAIVVKSYGFNYCKIENLVIKDGFDVRDCGRNGVGIFYNCKVENIVDQREHKNYDINVLFYG